MGMNILELVEEYGPIVFANSELGIIIQRNGSYYNLAVQGKDGWEHVDCRTTDGVVAYSITLAQAQDEAEAWFKELTAAEEEEAA